MQRQYRKNHASTGIEMTDSLIKWIEMRWTREETFHFDRVMEEKLPEGAMKDGKIVDMDQVIYHLRKLLYQVKAVPKRVFITIPSQYVIVRFLTLPDLPYKKLRKLIDAEVKHHLYLPFSDPHYDYVKLDRVAASMGDESKKNYPQCSVMLVAAPKAIVNQYVDLFHAVRLPLASIETKAFSLYRLIAALQPEMEQEVFMTVDLSETVGDLSIFDNGQLKLSRSVAVDFTSDFRHEEQEEFPDLFLTECATLAREIERVVKFYRYTLNYRTQTFRGLLLTGNLSRLDEVKTYLDNRLDTDVFMLKPELNRVSEESEAVNFVSYASVIGTALRGVVK